MSGNPKQPPTGGPQTPRYPSSAYQPILSQSINSSDGYHNPAATYVPQTQAPNQGPSLRSLPTPGPPNQSSTPPNADLKVPNMNSQLSHMAFMHNPPVRNFFTPRTAGPPTQAPRMPGQQHRGAQHPQVFSSPMVMYFQQPPVFYNQRPQNTLVAPQGYAQHVFSQQIAGYQFSSPPGSTGVQPSYPYSVYAQQSTMPLPARPQLTPPAVPSTNVGSSNIPSALIMNPQGPAHNSYTRSTNRTRRSNALAIIDPVTGEDKSMEIYEGENVASHPASGESSARQTPQPPLPNKEVQAAFAKQVAQAISEDRQPSIPVDDLQLHEIAPPPEHFHQPPPSLQPALPPRYDVQNSMLQYNAKEFVCSSAKPIKESTPIVSANSDAAEVILQKKDRESPIKSRKQSQRDSKPDITINECDKPSSIVKEDDVPHINVVENPHPPQVTDPSPPVIKETVKEVVVDKKSAKKPPPVEQKSPEAENHAQSAPIESASGKSKNARNKNVHNGKSQPASQVPQQQPAAVSVPPPQPPKANNKSNKTKELNIKGANKEGTDMDAFNDNLAKGEINANVVVTPTPVETVQIPPKEINSNSIPQETPQPQPATVNKETDTNISEQNTKDSNENITTLNTESVVNVNNITTAPTNTAPPAPVVKPLIKTFDVLSIVKDTAPNLMAPFPIDSKDETDKSMQNDTLISMKNDVNNKLSSATNDFQCNLIYRPGQWAPDRPDGMKVYERDFLLALKNSPASRQKPDNIPDAVLIDDRPRQVDNRASTGGRTDFTNPIFGYGGKSSSQRGVPSKRGSQSKMGSRGGDKSASKPQPKVSISLRGDVKLHEVENAWKPARFNKGDNMSDEDKKTEALYKSVRSILNKLTPQKFGTLVTQVQQLQIDTKDRLQGVIDLVFEKAVDEPNFSRAYAMMCKEIQHMQVLVEDDNKSVALRTLLITRCQMEFEKQSVNESDREVKVKEIEKCEDPEKKKELVFELEEYDRRLRMKSVGTMRFLGELFKQNLLTAKIMLRCLQSLLLNKDEESLECLCKLLTTVGKELESTKMDLSSIFDELKLIADGKRQKVSSRIRFMIQDVIDLKASKWVPRRGDSNPKTIDQIQKEADNEMILQHALNVNPPRKDDRNSSQRGGNSRPKVDNDGWNSVGSRSNRQSTFTIQTEKMRAAKFPPTDAPLGSSESFNMWGKGAAGGMKNVPSTGNIYASLDNNMDMDRRPMIARNNKEFYSSKGPSMERKPYNSYDGRGSRSGSQHRDSTTPMRNTGPPSSATSMMPPSNTLPKTKPQPSQAPIQPAVTPPSNVPKFTEDQIQRRVHSSLDEIIDSFCTVDEYFQDVSAVVQSSDYYKIVDYSCNHVIEKSQQARIKTSELFAKLIKQESISIGDFIKGFEDLLNCWEDLIIDIPHILKNYAEILYALVMEEVLPFPKLQKLLGNIIQSNKAKQVLKHLFDLIVKEKGSTFLQNLWINSGAKLSDFMPDSDVQPFIKENKLQFLFSGEHPVGQSSLSYEAIQKKLSELFQKKTAFDDIVNWISCNVGERVKEPKFIRALATAIFDNSICKNKLQPEVLSSHSKLIQKYVDTNQDYELQCLYALQSLINKLEHPQGLLLSICNKLYDDSTFSQESFIAWEANEDPLEQEGKGVAIKQLTSFFTQLKENEDDEYSSSEET